jgi:peptidoglycan/LPS O-acetylase OafA/YrhL
MNKFDHFIYLNEKNAFGLAFGLFLMVLYTFKNEAIIKGICNNIAVIVFNRISYGYYALIEIMINYMLCFIELQVQLNATNIIFLTFGLIFYIMALNIVLIVCFEIPVKILIKKMLKLKSDEKVKLLD